MSNTTASSTTTTTITSTTTSPSPSPSTFPSPSANTNIDIDTIPPSSSPSASSSFPAAASYSAPTTTAASSALIDRPSSRLSQSSRASGASSPTTPHRSRNSSHRNSSSASRSSSSSSSSVAVASVNKAPGILDRRKNARLGSRVKGGSNRPSVVRSSIGVMSMSAVAVGMRAKDAEDGEPEKFDNATEHAISPLQKSSANANANDHGDTDDNAVGMDGEGEKKRPEQEMKRPEQEKKRPEQEMKRPEQEKKQPEQEKKAEEEKEPDKGSQDSTPLGSASNTQSGPGMTGLDGTTHENTTNPGSAAAAPSARPSSARNGNGAASGQLSSFYNSDDAASEQLSPVDHAVIAQPSTQLPARPLAHSPALPPKHSPQTSSTSPRTSLAASPSSPEAEMVSPMNSLPAQDPLTRTAHGPFGSIPVVTHPPSLHIDRAESLEPTHSTTTSPPLRQAPGLARKASNGFGALLGRMGSIRKPRSPSAHRPDRLSEKSGSIFSSTSIEPNPSATVLNSRLSLQAQFSTLRRQEEFGGNHPDGHADGNGTEQRSGRAESDGNLQLQVSGSPTESIERAFSTGGLKSPPLDPKLPPGIASGISAGPASEPQEVDWDLWQRLVFEGPVAVAKTSGEELNRAITSGIPAPMRGVVWQVLAGSKNEELEAVYRTLKARGKDTEHRPVPTSHGSSASIHGISSDKDAATSDASSEHSDRSGTVTSSVASPPTSVDSHGHEARSRLLEEKLKRETVALQKLEKAIKRDLGTRTSYSAYAKSAGLQDGLFGVCKAYALFDEGVGYTQGINFLAMPLLFNMSEEEAFTLLVRLMSHYDLRSMFTADMTGLHMRLYQFERLLEAHDPAVYCHLRRRNVGPQLYATQWFLTLFAYRFPLQLVLRIYDLVLSEGLTAILKFGIVLMQRNRDALLEIKDMSQLANFLKERLFDVYIDKSPSASSLLDSGFFGSVSGGVDKELYRADEMVRDACKIKIPDDVLAGYMVEWEEQQRADRARESELDTLKTSNTVLAAQVKALEERLLQHDTEHVNIAQDLVKVKLENDTLLDRNEALEIRVAELQRMVDEQPAQVEQKLHDEMDRIMQRNVEVQNENRKIKEDMDEMEHELVNVKVAHAQMQEDHEALKQKWSSVQALLIDKSPS